LARFWNIAQRLLAISSHDLQGLPNPSLPNWDFTG